MARGRTAAFSLAVVAFTTLGVAVGCTSPGSAAPGKPRVVAGLYPLAYVARQVGASDVAVVDLTRPGAEPHDLELTPAQVGDVVAADVVLTVRGLQPAVDDAAATKHTLDAAAVGAAIVDAGGRRDPHVWLDPSRLAAVTERLADRLAAIDAPHATQYRQRATDLATSLNALDAEYRRGLAQCARHEVVTSHTAFGYLAQRYGLRQIGISGLDPDAEPAPRRIAEVARFVRAHGVTTVFFETLVSPKVAQTVAREAHLTTAVLDPVESVRDGGDYPTVMRRNLAVLRRALGCR
ncbi:MAG: metal ABC transporter substrate-binding protein [Mycobacteriales bacterium]